MARLGGKVSRCEVSSSQKTRFSRDFLSKPDPYLFSGPNWLYGAFGGKIVPDENFAQFCLKSTLEFVFSKKHVFGLNFCTKSHLTYFPGQTDKMARLGAKVSRSEVSSILKNTFSVRIFWWNRPHTSFLGLIGYMVHSGAKLFRTKTLFNFASKALSNSFFQKTRIRFEFFY